MDNWLLFAAFVLGVIAVAAFAFKPKRKPRVIEYPNVSPDDSFVITIERTLRPEEREAIRNTLESFRLGKTKVLVLESGLALTAILRAPKV